MILHKISHKVKRILNFLKREDVFAVLLIILVAFGSFGLGRLSVKEKTVPPITIQDAFPQVQFASDNGEGSVLSGNIENTQGQYVASKNGAKYHFPWCSGAQRIKEENKIWFATKEEAENAGYTPASNCKGL